MNGGAPISYRIYAALFPIYTTMEQFQRGDYTDHRYPFFIVWPLRWWRNLHILYLTYKVKKGNCL